MAGAQAATLCLVNAEREDAGLKPLKASSQLRKAAVSHSRDMVAERYFDHDSPSGSTVMSRVRKTGYFRKAKRFAARENIAWGEGARSTPREIVAGWMASPPHRAAILDARLRDASAGVAAGAPSGGNGTTYTLVLGMRRR